MLNLTGARTVGTRTTKLTLSFFSLALQREQYLREKKMGSDAYRKALDAQVTTSIRNVFVTREVTTKLTIDPFLTSLPSAASLDFVLRSVSVVSLVVCVNGRWRS